MGGALDRHRARVSIISFVAYETACTRRFRYRGNMTSARAKVRVCARRREWKSIFTHSFHVHAYILYTRMPRDNRTRSYIVTIHRGVCKYNATTLSDPFAILRATAYEKATVHTHTHVKQVVCGTRKLYNFVTTTIKRVYLRYIYTHNDSEGKKYVERIRVYTYELNGKFRYFK